MNIEISVNRDLVLPSYQGKGIWRLIMDKMQEIYKGFHMQMLTADGNAIDFYKRMALNGQVKQSLCGSIKVMITERRLRL
ncbi:GNAT family N-acetyltransferase [Sphingobacterium multivorum]|uniref:GNAT family N-acetyltransferase n=1 Tax=Sphingobacterium multivorum TaxID=28454 RepID=UPI00345E92E4